RQTQELPDGPVEEPTQEEFERIKQEVEADMRRQVELGNLDREHLPPRPAEEATAPTHTLWVKRRRPRRPDLGDSWLESFDGSCAECVEAGHGWLRDAEEEGLRVEVRVWPVGARPGQGRPHGDWYEADAG